MTPKGDRQALEQKRWEGIIWIVRRAEVLFVVESLLGPTGFDEPEISPDPTSSL